MICDYCRKPIPARIKGRGPKKKRFCHRQCRRGFYRAEEREGRSLVRRRARRRAKPLFEEEILKPENQAKVAEILAWAEAQHPAPPEAWGLRAAREEAA